MTQDLSTVSGQGRRFRFVRLLATGGFGEVYVAEMSNADGFAKTVTVKLMREDVTDPEQAQRMRDEARLLGMLHHPNIVQAEDLLKVAGRPAVVMEYVPGADLAAVLPLTTNPNPIPPRVGPQVIRKVALALDAAKNRPSTLTGEPLGVLHRDIKPANIRITPDGEVKVLDFGIARAENMAREAQTTDYQLGTLPYMSPEVLAGTNATHSSDIYALGVTLYEVLARKRFGWAGESEDTHDYQLSGRLAAIDFSDWKGNESIAIELLQTMLAFNAEIRPTAMEVAKTCREMIDMLEGEHLEDWALWAVPKAAQLSEDDATQGSLVGQVLAADTATSKQRGDIDSDSETMALPTGSSAVHHADPTIALPTAELEDFATTNEVEVSRVSYASWIGGILALGAIVGFFLVQQQRFVEAPTPTAVPAAQPPTTTDADETKDPVMEEGSAEDAESEDANPPDQTEATVAAQPAPTPALTTPTPEAVPAEIEEAAKPPPEAPPVAISTEPVSVRIASVPFGVPVEIDGTSVGTTPLRDLELLPGPHTLTFVDKGTPFERKVTVVEGGRNLWTYRSSDGSIE